MASREPRTLAEAYAQWWWQVGTPIMPPVQVDEMRKAFYSGCLAMMALALEASAEGRSVDEGAAIMDGLRAELHAFFKNLLRGERGEA